MNNAFRYLRIFLQTKLALKRSVNDWLQSLRSPTAYYLDVFQYFYLMLPRPLVAHKKYFSQNSRGFGEKAFHTMWYLLFKKFDFSNFLEIGVYRGQTISLISLIGKTTGKNIGIYGISPFSNDGDAVNSYIKIDYLNDVYSNF